MASEQTLHDDEIMATTTVPTEQQPGGSGGPAGGNTGQPAPPPPSPPATPVGTDSAAVTATTPIAIDGAAVVAAGKISTPVTLPDGKQVTSSELFSADGVTISRETVTAGTNQVDGTRTSDANQFPNNLVITTGNDHDKVNISQRADGTLDVDVNGKQFHVTLAPDQELGVRTNDGNDMVHAADNVTVNMDVNGGAGNDAITTGQGNDRIDAGAGDDVVRSGAGRDDAFGNTGNDTIDTGDGHDVAYGGDGDDMLQGGRGRDYLEGGKGNDSLLGGSGDDILSGGLGDDALLGQQGDDRVYTGAGSDTVTNTAGRDVVYGQSTDDAISAGKGATNTVTEVDLSATPGSSIDVSGSNEFTQRVEADLEFLRSSPEGRGLLTQLDAAAAAPGGHDVTIRELTHEHNAFAYGDIDGQFQHTSDPATGEPILTLDANGRPIPGPGVDSTVEYNPSDHDNLFPAPPITLFHELSHAYNNVTGTMYPTTQVAPGIDNGVPFAEHQVVGLPGTPAPYNFPGGGTTPTGTNPYTENDLRQEMGLPLRPSYSLPPTWDGGLGSPIAMAPTGTGSTPFTSTGDATLDRMLAAMQNGDTQGLKHASASLYDRDAGQFKEQGAVDLARQQSEEAKLHPIAPLQVEQPEQVAGGPRR